MKECILPTDWSGKTLSRSSSHYHDSGWNFGKVRYSTVRMRQRDDSFDEVPVAKDFQFRINETEVTKEYSYTLKKGKKLPYTVNFQAEGKVFVLSK